MSSINVHRPMLKSENQKQLCFSLSVLSLHLSFSVNVVSISASVSSLCLCLSLPLSLHSVCVSVCVLSVVGDLRAKPCTTTDPQRAPVHRLPKKQKKISKGAVLYFLSVLTVVTP